MSLKRIAVVLALLTCIGTATAGEIRLTNGDRLAGELESITEDNIIWNSGTVGSIRIPKDEVLAITSSTELKLQGRDEPCYWQELRGSQVIFACADGDLDFEPLYGLKDIAPFVTEGEGFYEHKGNFTLSGNRFGGNVRQEDWSLDANWMVRYSDVRHNIGADYQSRSFEDSPLDEMYQFNYAFDWFFKPRGYWQNQISLLTDESRTIQERYGYGTGLGYELVNSAVALLSFEVGLRYEKTIYEVIPPYNPNIDYTTEVGLWRLGGNFRYSLPLEIDFRHQTYYFQPLEAPNEWRLESDTGFSLPLGFGISANINYEYDYENIPPEQSIGRDSVLRFGLNYSW